MTSSTLITDYVGRGTHAARPVTPNIPTGATAFYYETDTTIMFEWTGAAWVAVGGGYSAGTVPTVVQTAFSVGGGNSATFGVAPTNGNLLVAMCFNPLSQTAGAGWTSQASNSTGTDFGVILTKVAGAGESTTQSPLSGVGGTGGMVIWEINGQAGSGYFVVGNTQAEASGTSNTPVLLPNLANCIGLSAVGVVTTPTISVGYNGTQDVLDNTGGRKLYANHTDLSKTPMAGVVATFSASANSKSATCLISH